MLLSLQPGPATLTHELALDELHQQCQPDTDSHDDLLVRLADTAFVTIEERLQRSLHMRSFTVIYKDDVDVFLPRGPVVEGSISASTGNQAIAITQAGDTVFPATEWPSGQITVTYQAGMPTLPEPLRHAALILCRHWYDYRGVVDENRPMPIPETLTRLLSSYKRGPRA